MSKSLRVLQVLPELNLGGVERGTLEVGKALAERGHQSFVVSGGGRLVEQLEREGSKHFTLLVGKKSLFTLRYIKPLRDLILKNNIDIVHVRSRFPAWITKFALDGIDKNIRPKLVSTVHGAYSVNAYSKIMLKADKIIAVSDFIKDYICINYPDIDSNKIKVIYRGISNEDFPSGFMPSSQWKDDWFKQFPACKNKLILCLPGRITRLKGHEDFLKILHELKTNSNNFNAIIVGSYDKNKSGYFNSLKKKISESNLEDHVTFTGARNDIKEIISISDIIFNLSNKPESFGRTALEALSLKTPVIANNHGGVKDILEELFPEGLININNTEQAIEKINTFSNSLINIKDNKRFTLKNMLDNTINLYHSIT